MRRSSAAKSSSTIAKRRSWMRRARWLRATSCGSGPIDRAVRGRDRARARGAPLRLVATRANDQPAFGCYLPDPQVALARAYGLLVLTLRGDRISAITWFFDSGLFPHFGLPRTLPDGRDE